MKKIPRFKGIFPKYFLKMDLERNTENFCKH